MQEGTKAMETYYNPEDLDKFSTMGEEAPELWDLYMAYYGKVFAEGALTAREKALIALAVAGAVQCQMCIRDSLVFPLVAAALFEWTGGYEAFFVIVPAFALLSLLCGALCKPCLLYTSRCV